MSTQNYEPLAAARFTSSNDGIVTKVIIPAQKNLFTLAFLCVWICGWTVGGIAAMHSFWTRPEPFLMFWLCMWALGLIAAAAQIAWFTTGREIVSASLGDLEIIRQIAGFKFRKLYRGANISGMAAQPAPQFPYAQQVSPFFSGKKFGSIAFAYGPRSVYFAMGMDPVEAQAIISSLRKNLPPGAIAK